jgi:hypothetical protein
LGKRRIGNIAALRKQTRAWNRRVNYAKATIQWKFTRRQAIDLCIKNAIS